MKRSVLIVEEDDLSTELLKHLFIDAGYDVTIATDGIRAIELGLENDYDIIVMDVMLPEIDGFSVCRKIRKSKDTPIIVISSRDNEEDQLIAYDLGADDYFTKPFNPKLVLAKSNVLIKRARGVMCGGDIEISSSGIVINLESHTVKIDDDYIDLTPKEYELLIYLMMNKGKVLSRDMLLSKVWGYDYFGDLRTVDTHIKKLRAKLGDKAVHIKTLIKVGYKFDDKTV